MEPAKRKPVSGITQTLGADYIWTLGLLMQPRTLWTDRELRAAEAIEELLAERSENAKDRRSIK
jgi:hypothetical protein